MKGVLAVQQGTTRPIVGGHHRSIHWSNGMTLSSLSLSSLYNSLFATDFDAHDALGDCEALSEVLLAVIPGKIFVKYGNLLTMKEVKNDISKRSVIRRTVISLQDLPVSKGIKEKLGMAGIGLQQLNKVFAKHGTKGLLSLLAIPPNGLKAPRVTKNKNILTRIINFFENRRQ